MFVSKSALSKAIRAIDDFDTAASPFAGMQWSVPLPLFHRSGLTGFIESEGYRDAKPDVILSIAHLRSMLAVFEEDGIEMSTDRSGVLTLRSSNSEHSNTVGVYTIRENVAWAKTHDPGPRTVKLDPEAFLGINTGPFPLIAPPVLRRRRLMLTTANGVIMRSNVPVETYPYPRESFLRTISGLKVEDLYMTHNGYWAASAGGFRIMVCGHRSGEALFDVYDRAATLLAEIPAARLIFSLSQAATIAAKGRYVSLDPSMGVQCRDIYGNEATFSLGVISGWDRFLIPTATASNVANVLRQGGEEMARLERFDQDTLRVKRGDWEISFGYFADNSTR